NKLDEREEAKGNTLNNLAVLCGDLEMRGKAVELYKRAAQSGNTLPVANLAYLHMNAGFYDEANDLLKKASQSDSVHKNVITAQAALVKSKSEETERWEKVISTATRQQTFAMGYAEALLAPGTFAWSGVRWNTHTGHQVEFSSKSQILTCE